MASQTVVILYPEDLPGTQEDRQAAERLFGSNFSVIRRNLANLAAVSQQDAAGTHVLMVYKLAVQEHHLHRFPNLRVIVRLGVGYDKVDLEAASKRGITVHNVPDYGSAAVAHHALTLASTLARNITGYHDALRKPGPIDWDPTTMLSKAPWDHTFGIVGFGRIGSALAAMAKAVGYNVLFYDPYLTDYQPVERITRLNTLEGLLSQSDILSLNVPATDETRNMIGATQIALLPPGAFIVNTARGSVLDLDAAASSIKNGHLGGIGLDVLPTEPLVDGEEPNIVRDYRNNQSYLHGKMIVTPHSASHSPRAIANVHAFSAGTAISALEGNFVNKVN